MDKKTRRQRFRALLNSDRCAYTGTVFDPISARIAEDLGFEVGMYAGSVASMTVTGAPDLMGLTLTEFVEQAYRITRAGNLSVLVDADDGYGNAINVMRTVNELENAGIAAMTLEDTNLPPPFGAGGKTRLLSVEEGVGKMTAALEARSDADFVIVARTSAPSVTSLDDAIERLRAYVETGVDAIFPIGINTREALDTLHDAVTAPIVLPVGPGPLADLDYLASRGVRVALQPHTPFEAQVRAVYDTLAAVKNGTPADLGGLAGKDLMKQVTRAQRYDEWMEKFVG